MSGARAQILDRLRGTLGDVSDRKAAVDAHLSQRSRGPLPAWPEEMRERFCAKLEGAAGSLTRVSDGLELVAAVRAYLDNQGLPLELVLAPHPRLHDLPWSDDWTLHRRPVGDGDLVGLSLACAGIAETGSLMLASSADTPAALNFLVDDFLCLLPAERILPHLEDAWDLVRARPEGMPRALNLITGPSRTADVEQTIQLGAHGPRRLHVLLWDAE